MTPPNSVIGNTPPVTSKHSQSYLQLLAASTDPKADSIVTLKAYRQETVRESIFTHNTGLIRVALYPFLGWREIAPNARRLPKV